MTTKSATNRYTQEADEIVASHGYTFEVLPDGAVRISCNWEGEQWALAFDGSWLNGPRANMVLMFHHNLIVTAIEKNREPCLCARDACAKGLTYGLYDENSHEVRLYSWSQKSLVWDVVR